MTALTDKQASLCPLCGAPNQCAVASGEPAEQCWCMQVSIGEDALAAIPAEARNTVCLCPACAGKHTGESHIAR